MYLKTSIQVLTACIFFLNADRMVYSQSISRDSARAFSGITPLKDIVDVFKSVRKRNVVAIPDSSETKRSRSAFIPILYPGYAQVTGFQAVLTSNFLFYTERGENAKISSILMNNLYTQNNQIINLINSNIWTPGGKFNLVGDFRLYKFPTNTFGLGSSSTLDDKQHVDYSYLKIYEVVMRKIASNLSGGMGYDFDYHWNISETPRENGDSTDIERYGFDKTSSSSGITLNIQYDSRLSSNNPLQGTYAFLELRNNIKAIGSDNNWQSMLLDVRKYIPVSKRSNNVLALWSYNWITIKGNIPYFDLPSLGWDHYNNMGRGYVQGRYRAWNMVYAEAEYRFHLTKNGLLGGVLFTNASTLTEYPSNTWENVNPGAGLGLRIKMNKLSNTNFAIDYGFGVGGSRGLSFNLNEVF